MESLLYVYTRGIDGYLNATACCKLYKKRWIKFKCMQSTIECFHQAKQELGSGVPLFEITYGRSGTTWLHPYLIPHFTGWLIRGGVKAREEADCQERLAYKLRGEVEITTPVGRIDILTKKEIIEIKTAKDWKEGIGQLMVYSLYYPMHQRRLHLFGSVDESYRRMIRDHCFKFGIRVTWD